ncbi:MAG: hypothetical protein HRT36_04930 [Alphaproteobacteria bacterium]|nr:hypothetical protein [Alphaproteobacteria bacterium]
MPHLFAVIAVSVLLATPVWGHEDVLEDQHSNKLFLAHVTHNSLDQAEASKHQDQRYHQYFEQPEQE